MPSTPFPGKRKGDRRRKAINPYDVFVIGSGPGGYTAAVLAAKKGLRVGIAEGSRMGGTCTNTGCIPTKAYIESVNLLSKIRDAARFGIQVDNPRIDFSKVKTRKDRIVTRLSKGVEYLLKQNTIDVYRGKASLPEKGTIKVGDESLEAKNIILATGSRPKRLPVLETCDVWTSDEIFNITSLPASLAIIGGGVIGMEMAHIFSTLGVKVSIIEALARILPLEDRHVSEYIARIYRRIDIRTSTRICGANGSGPYTLSLDTPEGLKTLETEKILLCIGREPVLPEGAHELGLARSQSGGVRVDEYLRTSIPGIYAVGDVTGEHMYAYVASREAAVAVGNITGSAAAMSYVNIPSVIFTEPEVASVGHGTEEDGTGDIRTGTFPVSASGRARTMEENEGYAHVTATNSGELRRISIIAPHATELIPWATLALHKGLSAREFLEPFCPHPVLAELLKEAAEDIEGISVHHP